MEHYYSQKPTTAHKAHTIEESLRGRKYTFVTDAGVFSKRGVDYGSKVLIEALDIPDKAEVLDVGCGYGPIGFAAAGLAVRGKVTMVDINERAVELAKQNAQRNQITNVEILQSDMLGAVINRNFDVVITNPPIRAGKETVHRIFEQAYEVLNAGGSLWIVIQKKQGAPSAFAKLESLFAKVTEVTKDKGYRVIRAIK
ncbi:class I SAM-dependent methyltransferase [Paenibacillus radicis (ex Xue et al. 2023)]|uniref:Class I SAM-dependent methyltransferase n=1 Tax=Paenibacillus radicis (ex Xue et al. 2023) TaxID=2972489 RepID=A0ABT1YUS3_9BACL|nr:class I SAM-dependent methyltransferase [Paenibacillus radicis (ex Xue et al. 2023)]MCR8636315.1 class I SAM-dependent methyltransferase [Paenibacillus radicis (ex Xue et al. 2023)]